MESLPGLSIEKYCVHQLKGCFKDGLTVSKTLLTNWKAVALSTNNKSVDVADESLGHADVISKNIFAILTATTSKRDSASSRRNLLARIVNLLDSNSKQILLVLLVATFARNSLVGQQLDNLTNELCCTLVECVLHRQANSTSSSAEEAEELQEEEQLNRFNCLALTDKEFEELCVVLFKLLDLISLRNGPSSDSVPVDTVVKVTATVTKALSFSAKIASNRRKVYLSVNNLLLPSILTRICSADKSNAGIVSQLRLLLSAALFDDKDLDELSSLRIKCTDRSVLQSFYKVEGKVTSCDGALDKKKNSASGSYYEELFATIRKYCTNLTVSTYNQSGDSTKPINDALVSVEKSAQAIGMLVEQYAKRSHSSSLIAQKIADEKNNRHDSKSKSKSDAVTAVLDAATERKHIIRLLHFAMAIVGTVDKIGEESMPLSVLKHRLTDDSTVNVNETDDFSKKRKLNGPEKFSSIGNDELFQIVYNHYCVASIFNKVFASLATALEGITIPSHPSVAKYMTLIRSYCRKYRKNGYYIGCASINENGNRQSNLPKKQKITSNVKSARGSSGSGVLAILGMLLAECCHGIRIISLIDYESVTESFDETSAGFDEHLLGTVDVLISTTCPIFVGAEQANSDQCKYDVGKIQIAYESICRVVVESTLIAFNEIKDLALGTDIPVDREAFLVLLNLFHSKHQLAQRIIEVHSSLRTINSLVTLIQAGEEKVVSSRISSDELVCGVFASDATKAFLINSFKEVSIGQTLLIWQSFASRPVGNLLSDNSVTASSSNSCMNVLSSAVFNAFAKAQLSVRLNKITETNRSPVDMMQCGYDQNNELHCLLAIGISLIYQLSRLAQSATGSAEDGIPMTTLCNALVSFMSLLVAWVPDHGKEMLLAINLSKDDDYGVQCVSVCRFVNEHVLHFLDKHLINANGDLRSCDVLKLEVLNAILNFNLNMNCLYGYVTLRDTVDTDASRVLSISVVSSLGKEAVIKSADYWLKFVSNLHKIIENNNILDTIGSNETSYSAIRVLIRLVKDFYAWKALNDFGVDIDLAKDLTKKLIQLYCRSHSQLSVCSTIHKSLSVILLQARPLLSAPYILDDQLMNQLMVESFQLFFDEIVMTRSATKMKTRTSRGKNKTTLEEDTLTIDTIDAQLISTQLTLTEQHFYGRVICKNLLSRVLSSTKLLCRYILSTKNGDACTIDFALKGIESGCNLLISSIQGYKSLTCSANQCHSDRKQSKIVTFSSISFLQELNQETNSKNAIQGDLDFDQMITQLLSAKILSTLIDNRECKAIEQFAMILIDDAINVTTINSKKYNLEKLLLIMTNLNSSIFLQTILSATTVFENEPISKVLVEPRFAVLRTYIMQLRVSCNASLGTDSNASDCLALIRTYFARILEDCGGDIECEKNDVNFYLIGEFLLLLMAFCKSTRSGHFIDKESLAKVLNLVSDSTEVLENQNNSNSRLSTGYFHLMKVLLPNVLKIRQVLTITERSETQPVVIINTLQLKRFCKSIFNAIRPMISESRTKVTDGTPVNLFNPEVYRDACETTNQLFIYINQKIAKGICNLEISEVMDVIHAELMEPLFSYSTLKDDPNPHWDTVNDGEKFKQRKFGGVQVVPLFLSTLIVNYVKSTSTSPDPKCAKQLVRTFLNYADRFVVNVSLQGTDCSKNYICFLKIVQDFFVELAQNNIRNQNYSTVMSGLMESICFLVANILVCNAIDRKTESRSENFESVTNIDCSVDDVYLESIHDQLLILKNAILLIDWSVRFTNRSKIFSFNTVIANLMDIVTMIIRRTYQLEVAQSAKNTNNALIADKHLGALVHDIYTSTSRCFTNISNSLDMSKHIPYIITATVFAVSKVTISPSMRENLFPGIYTLFEKIQLKQKNQVFNLLDPVAKVLMTDLHNEYLRTFKFIGK